MIAHNENARGGAVRGPIKHGDALLAGLLRCGHCGAKLLAQYPGPRVIRYQCSGYLLNRDHACCVMFGGLRADRLVSEQLLQCLTPFGIEAAIEAIENRSEEHTSELQSRLHLVCRLLLEKKKIMSSATTLIPPSLPTGPHTR